MATRLPMRDRTLLLNSEIIKQFPEIKRIIEETVKISDEFVSNLPEDKKNFFDNVLNKVLKEAISEWKGDPEKIEDTGPDRSKRKRCSLENNPNRYIFYINNKLNGTSLNVGSECINHFWESLSSNYEGKTIAQLKRDAGKIRLLSDLNDKIPGISRIIDSWNLPVSDCEVILPRFLEKPYLDLEKKASRLFDDYLNGKEECNYAEELKLILENQRELICGIEQYTLEKSSNKFVPKKEVRIWLNNQGLTKVIDKLKDDGIIKWPTAHRIAESSFMNSLIPTLNTKGIMNLDLKIISADERRSGYIVEATKSKMNLFIKHKDLIFDFGWLIFDDEEPLEELSLESLLKYCSINDKKDILNFLDFMTYRHGISFEEVDLESNEVFVFDEYVGKYVSTKPLQLANKFKGLVIGAKDITSKEFLNYIKNLPGSRYSKSELEELRLNRWEFNIEKF